MSGEEEEEELFKRVCLEIKSEISARRRRGKIFPYTRKRRRVIRKRIVWGIVFSLAAGLRKTQIELG